jgi:type I restriction enzyme S subunit
MSDSKHSKPQRLPKLAAGWHYIDLGTIIDPKRPITYGVVQPGSHDPDGIPLIRGGDYSDGWRPLGALRRVSRDIERQYSRARLKTGDLVITIKGDVGSCAQVPEWLDGANLSQTNARLAVDPRKASSRYVLHYLQSDIGQREIHEHTKTGAQPGLIFGDIRKFRIPIPERIELQHAICEVLNTWDEAVLKLEALLAVKNQRLAGLTDDLIFGKRRVDGFRNRWRTRKLGEVTTELSARNGGRFGRDVVMGVTKANGIVPMREQTIGDDLTRYKVLPTGAFAYNPMRINVGSIAMSRCSGDVLVSPDYVLFQCNHGKLSPDYLDHLCHTHSWNHHINANGSGSVRVRIYYDDLAAIRLPLPELDEQLAITSVLNAARHDLALTRRHIGLLKHQKRGLMQKLLVGEWPVKEIEKKEAAA